MNIYNQKIWYKVVKTKDETSCNFNIPKYSDFLKVYKDNNIIKCNDESRYGLFIFINIDDALCFKNSGFDDVKKVKIKKVIPLDKPIKCKTMIKPYIFNDFYNFDSFNRIIRNEYLRTSCPQGTYTCRSLKVICDY